MLTLRLLPESVGVLSLITSTYSFLAPFILLSTSGAFFVEYFKKEYTGEFSNYFSNALILNFILFVFFLLVALCGLNTFANIVNCPKEWILAIPFLCYFDSVKASVLSVLQIKKNALLYSFFSLGYSVLNFSFSFLFVFKYGLDYQGRLSGIFIAGITIAFVSFFVFWKMNLLKFSISKNILKDIINYGFPILPHSIGLLILDVSDRYFINFFNGKYELGVYSISYLLGSVIYIIAGAFSTAWVPYLYDELKNDTHRSNIKIVKISYWYILGLVLFCVIYIICIPIIYKIFINENYYSGISYCYIIVIGYFFTCIYLIFAGILFYEKKNYIFGYVSGINIICNLVLNYFLIKKYGVFGAAIATSISMFLFMVLIAYFSHRLRPLPWALGFKEFLADVKGKLI